MTDYVKSTNFASKDSLPTGNPSKIVKGTEIDTEFNNIATAVATKLDKVDGTATANGVAYYSASKILTSGSALSFDGTYLGIGTSSPGAYLDVTSVAGTTTARFSSGGDAFIQAGASGTATNNFHFGADYTGSFVVYQGNYGAGSERLRINSTGASIAGNFTAGGSVTATGNVTGAKVRATTAGQVDSVEVTDTGTNGANIKLVGNGATTPNKYVRAQNGLFQILNSSYSAPILEVTDDGAFRMNSGYGSMGTTYGCRAWVNFNGTGSAGSNQTIRANGNVATVYKTGTGRYRITFTNSMPDANYAISMPSPSASGSAVAGVDTSYGSQTAAYVDVAVRTAGGTYVDSDNIHVAVFR
jgi:hypothetical protein